MAATSRHLELSPTIGHLRDRALMDAFEREKNWTETAESVPAGFALTYAELGGWLPPRIAEAFRAWLDGEIRAGHASALEHLEDAEKYIACDAQVDALQVVRVRVFGAELEL